MKSRFALLLVFTMLLGSVHMLGQSAIWTDPATKLMWARQDNGSDVNWNQARNYCAKLRLSGSTNWRLATIDELAGIYDPTQNADGWHIKGGIKLSGSPWSSSPGSDSVEAWSFYFDNGERRTLHHDISYSNRALCVRRSGK
jgi:uncharacterized protein DUF1566